MAIVMMTMAMAMAMALLMAIRLGAGQATIQAPMVALLHSTVCVFFRPDMHWLHVCNGYTVAQHFL